MINSNFLEPISYYNLSELKEGDWIWDNKKVSKREHGRRLDPPDILEPYGFRQIHILDLDQQITKPFMLSDHDKGYYKWEYFEFGRFYKFKK